MRRIISTMAAMLLLLSMLAGPATARPSQFEESHGHMLILGAEVEVIEGMLHAVGYRKCIDMPVTPLRGHHANVHTGQAGMALEAAGHAFVPSSGFRGTPWENCAEFATFLPLPLEQAPPL